MSYKSKILINLDESEWAKAENSHEPIVSKFDYDAVQRILAIDTRIAPRHNKVHLFSGLLICGCCGGGMTRKITGNGTRRYVYYFCPASKRKGCRLSFVVRENDLVQTVTAKIREHIANIQQIADHLSKPYIEDIFKKGYSHRIATYIQNISDLQMYKSHLCHSLTCDIINHAEFQELQIYYDREIDRLHTEIASLQGKLHSIKNSHKTEFIWMDNFLEFDSVSELSRYAVARMIQKITIIGKNEIEIDFVCRDEYKEVVQYLAMGGCDYGKKKS